jgi:adenylate kinase family enzyme
MLPSLPKAARRIGHSDRISHPIRSVSAKRLAPAPYWKFSVHKGARDTEMRVVVVGTSGAGKTTMAKSIASALDLPCIELDSLNWAPSWQDLSKTNPDEFTQKVRDAISAAAWVSDGNYAVVRDMVWRRATHLVWLDYSRGVVMYRVIKRSIARALDQKELWAGNKEDWRRWLRPSHPIRWAWSTWKGRRSRFEGLLNDARYGHLVVLRLRTPRDVARAVSRLKMTA